MNNKELKELVCELINAYNYSNEELNLIYDIIFFIYTEDYERIEHKVKEFRNEGNIFRSI